MTCNSEEGSPGGHEPGSPSFTATVPAGISAALRILGGRIDRHVLLDLRQQDEPISVDTLAAHVTTESSSLQIDGVVRPEGRFELDSRS